MKYLLITSILLAGCQTPKLSPPIEDVIYLQQEDYIAILDLHRRLAIVEESTSRVDDMISRGVDKMIFRDLDASSTKILLLARPIDPNSIPMYQGLDNIAH